jgi:hypothetical protein
MLAPPPGFAPVRHATASGGAKNDFTAKAPKGA